jgi:hypothetical protein
MLLGGEVGEPPEGAAVVGDSLYGNTTAVWQVQAERGVLVIAGLQIKRVSDRFTYDAKTDQMVCAERMRSIGSIERENGRLYYLGVPDCGACPRKTEGLTSSELEGRPAEACLSQPLPEAQGARRRVR